ncbi:BURP domain-containing protein [Tanacetum coccineum]
MKFRIVYVVVVASHASIDPEVIKYSLSGDSLPFTSNKIQDIYKAFKVNPGSLEASLIKKTIINCEKASNKEEDQYCANSLESMVDYASSKL